MEDIVKLLIDVNKISVTLASWCLSNVEDQIHSHICSKSFKVIDEAVEAVLKHIATKVFDDKVKMKGDPLSKFYVTIINAVAIAKTIIKNTIIIQEERVLCRVLKPTTISEKLVERGYLVLLPVDQAIILSALGYVEPIYVSVPIQ